MAYEVKAGLPRSYGKRTEEVLPLAAWSARTSNHLIDLLWATSTLTVGDWISRFSKS